MRIFQVFLLFIAPITAIAKAVSIEQLVAASHTPYSNWALVLVGVLTGILATLVTRYWLMRCLFVTIGMAISAACFAPVIVVPNNFSNGQPADADQVNANFDNVVTQIAEHVDNESLHSNDTEESLVTLEADGSVSIKTPGGSSGIYIRPNGNIEIIGNTVTVNAGNDARINAGGSAEINAANAFNTTAGTQTNVISAGGISIQGASIDTNSGTTTNINSGGALSLVGATIDLN